MESTHAVSARESRALTPCLPADRPRTWLRRIFGGGVVPEACPSWCVATHQNDQDLTVGDLMHEGPTAAMRLPMHVDGGDMPMAWPVLAATVRQWPYDESEDRRQPYVGFEPAADEVIVLGEDGLRTVIAQIRAHADRLEQQVLAQLVAARAEDSVTATA